jgi:hypothetical protein
MRDVALERDPRRAQGHAHAPLGSNRVRQNGSVPDMLIRHPVGLSQWLSFLNCKLTIRP